MFCPGPNDQASLLKAGPLWRSKVDDSARLFLKSSMPCCMRLLKPWGATRPHKPVPSLFGLHIRKHQGDRFLVIGHPRYVYSLRPLRIFTRLQPFGLVRTVIVIPSCLVYGPSRFELLSNLCGTSKWLRPSEPVTRNLGRSSHFALVIPTEPWNNQRVKRF